MISRLLFCPKTYKWGRKNANVVEKSKETYYEVLQDSSTDWHENTNDYMPFIKYTFGTIINAYKDFEERFVLLEKKK